MKKGFFSALAAIAVSFIAPQVSNAQSQSNANDYEVEIIYNKTDKTTTIVLYKDGVEVGREIQQP